MPLGMDVGLGLRDIVFDVDPATPWKKSTPTPTQFLAHVYCGQMAGWMKTPLGTEVDLGPGHIVLYGVPAPAKGSQQPPSFRPMFIVTTVAHLCYCWAFVIIKLSYYRKARDEVCCPQLPCFYFAFIGFPACMILVRILLLLGPYNVWICWQCYVCVC